MINQKIKIINPILRLLLLIIIIFPIYYYHEFYEHFYVYLTGNVISRVITQEWHVVLISIVLFCAFLIPLSYRRRAPWMEYGLVGAFFVSLFIEMYGIPLTILFAAKYFLASDVILPDNVVGFHLFGVGFGMDLPMAYAAVIMAIGMILIIWGWVTLYFNIKKDQPVTVGIYQYSRHPQYLGFILIVLGWFIGWPTILTIIFTPILIYKYITVCRTEEAELLKQNPQYQQYIHSTPFFV
ncbi:MAG: methyltransferase [Patescibacteria group bacterium]